MWNILLECRICGFLFDILDFAKKGQNDRNRHFWSIDPGRGIALISSLMPASPYFPHWSWAGHRLNPINFEIENVFLHRPFQGEASPWNITEFTGIHVCCYVILQNSLAFMCVVMYTYDRYVNFFFWSGQIFTLSIPALTKILNKFNLLGTKMLTTHNKSTNFKKWGKKTC